MSKPSIEKRIEALEAQAGIGQIHLVTWCGCPNHEPDLTQVPPGAEACIIATGMTEADCAPLPWPEPSA